MRYKKTLKFIALLTAAAFLVALAVIYPGRKYYESSDYVWISDDGNALIRGRKIDKIKNDINKLVFAFNGSEKNPETFRTPEDKEPADPPKLKLIDLKGQVADVEVFNDEHLTERMGSTGADAFLAAATFTLTEYDNLKFVNFIFEPGDHAEPGLYSRETFLQNWKVAK